MRSRDQRLDVDVQLSDEWQSSLFDSLQTASDFIRCRLVSRPSMVRS